MKEKLQAIDVKTVLIVLLVAVSFAHVGLLFGNREAEGRAIVGYLLALAIDGVLAVSLYEIAGAQKPEHKRLALAGFLVASAISGAFNVAYYRKYHPQDAFALSVLLGITAPLLAAFLAVLKSLGDTERQETANRFEIERETALAEIEAQKAIALEAEKTKRAKERTKQQRLKAEKTERQRQAKDAELERKRMELERKDKEELRQALTSLGKAIDALKLYADNPTLSRVEAAERLGTTRQTLGKYLGRFEALGVAQRNNGRVDVLVEKELLNDLLSEK